MQLFVAFPVGTERVAELHMALSLFQQFCLLVFRMQINVSLVSKFPSR